jgi:hypothetical protein
MITRLPNLKLSGHGYLIDYPVVDYTLFNQSLNETAEYVAIDTGVYYSEFDTYGKYYLFEESEIDNLVYDATHNGRFHFKLKGLKYYSNISDLWYMNSILIGYNNRPEIIYKNDVAAVSLQSFGNINLAVDAFYLSSSSIVPAGKTLSEGLFDATQPGIRLVMFVDKIDLVERTVGTNKVKNLQFHFTLKAYLIDPLLGGRYQDFTTTSLIGQKSFYYEQTVSTYARRDFQSKNSLKTGWGHFIYPVTTGDSTAITYVQLEDVLKTVYNSVLYCQSTENQSLKVNSTALLNWLNTDITLKNASDAYVPSSVTPKNPQPPSPFTETNVLKTWLSDISTIATGLGSNVDFLLSYDNIYFEPLNDSFNGDVYSNSPATFITRLTTYYEGPGQTPVDGPGNFQTPGGFPKKRIKYFLSNLIKYIIPRSSVDPLNISPYFGTEFSDRFIGPKFFPFYRFKQYKDNVSGKELLDLVTIPFSSAESSINVIECETSQDLKKVVPDNLNPYRRKIITKVNVLPSSLGATTTDIINNVGFVEYIDDDQVSKVIQLNSNAGIRNKYIFAFLTLVFISPAKIGQVAQWTKNGRYFLNPRELDSITELTAYSWTNEQESLCSIMSSGMYDTPEDAYIKYKSIIQKIYINTSPSPSDPSWKDYYKCLPSSETLELTYEYCDPSPSPDGRQVLKRIKSQRVSTSSLGIKTNVGNPTYEYPATTITLKNQTQTINGKTITGDKVVVYKDCEEFSNTFIPYPIAPTGPVITTGPTGKKKKEVDLSLEDFINPAVFKVNEIVLSPSDYPIILDLQNAYYRIVFNQEEVGESSSDYVIKLSPGKRGQVIVLEINTNNAPYKGVQLINKDTLSNDRSSQRVYISSDVWGDGTGVPVKSVLFMIYSGNDWIEFLRRDIY